MDLRGKKALVMGLGRHGGGCGAARFLAMRGALVTVTDSAHEQPLGESVQSLSDLPVNFHLGEHWEADFRQAEILVVNPAIRPNHPLVELARGCGALVTSEIELFLNLCTARVVGVTGSNGKSTTSAMIAAIFAAAGRRCWLGGNIGRSLLPDVDQIAAADEVVLELSSFQLTHLSPRCRTPELAVVTNFSPTHLDWHPDIAEYRQAKQRLITGQRADDVLVLNSDDPEFAGWKSLARGNITRLTAKETIPELLVPGKHNRHNAVLAATAAHAAGCSAAAITSGLASFPGLPHRLQLIAEVAGRRFFNDSMATTVPSVIAALQAIEKPVWLLAGGKEKGDDLAPLAEAIVKHARGACFFGAARDHLMSRTAISLGKRASDVDQEIRRTVADRPLSLADFQAIETLHDAIMWCWRRSSPGDAILLSPACASYDQFRDYRHRAESFANEIARIQQQFGNSERKIDIDEKLLADLTALR